jgi:lipoprotein-anchoring transpeptidase ErfK/SrfK
MRMRRTRAIVILLSVVLVIAGVVYVWANPIKTTPRYTAVLNVGLASPVDLTAPAMLYARDYVANLKPPEPPGPAKLTPSPKIKTIMIDKSEQMVTLYASDGTPVDWFQCASGVTYPRVGTYKVTSKKTESSYPEENLRFYHFVIFAKSDKNTNIGFHSIPVDVDGNEIGGLGKPESHGCVRLAHDKAEYVYKWAPIGAKVIVRN